MAGADVVHRHYLSELFVQHHAWLCLRLRRLLDSEQSAEDVASETFLQLLASPNVVPIRDPRALLTTIAQRLVYERWRRRDQERDYLEGLGLEALFLLRPQKATPPRCKSLTVWIDALTACLQRSNQPLCSRAAAG
jgi:DNA-directed RNA polymerase specialized sigma24 family protein